jgi:hypothetical protein
MSFALGRQTVFVYTEGRTALGGGRRGWGGTNMGDGMRAKRIVEAWAFIELAWGCPLPIIVLNCCQIDSP